MTFKEFRKSQDLTQREVALKVSVSTQTIRFWEQELSQPKDENKELLRTEIGWDWDENAPV